MSNPQNTKTARKWVGMATKTAAKKWGDSWSKLTREMRHGAASIELLAIFAAQDSDLLSGDQGAARIARIFVLASEHLGTFFE